VDASAEAMVRQASLLDRRGRVTEAIAAYQSALDRWPDLPNSWYNLAVLQRKAGDYSTALASYQQALDRGVKRPEEVHVNRGVIYADHLRQPEAAEREYRRALALTPAYVPALFNLGNLYEDLGLREAALEAYEKILAADPACYAALARHANLHTVTDPDDRLIERLRTALGGRSATAADRAVLGFALGRLLDGCGSYAAAFGAYRAANVESRASAAPGTAVYDRAVEEQLIHRMAAAFPAAAQAPAAAPPGSRQVAMRQAPQPVFVCGMFRSGSTLIEQLLGRHPRVTAGGELEFIPRAAREQLAPFPESMATVSADQLQSVAARYLDTLADMFPGAQFVTDKRPDNFVFIGLIKTLFPAAKIVHTRRDPQDNCLSIYFLHLDHRMSYALDMLDIGHHYRQYLRLMAHWKGLYGADIFDVDYDAFVREPGPLAQRLLAFLGLEWDERCLAPPPSGEAVRTASVWQVREPIYQRSSGRARHYQRELAELREYLART
jgi:tetratricopeptide (TPR) repeat protein